MILSWLLWGASVYLVLSLMVWISSWPAVVIVLSLSSDRHKLAYRLLVCWSTYCSACLWLPRFLRRFWSGLRLMLFGVWPPVLENLRPETLEKKPPTHYP